MTPSWQSPFVRAVRAGAYIVAHTVIALLLIAAIYQENRLAAAASGKVATWSGAFRSELHVISQLA
jgi:hypothetical protein